MSAETGAPGVGGGAVGGPVVGDDGRARCGWAAHPELYRSYHDTEWGVPVHGRDRLFERLSLECFQSGLAWITVLRKRPAFRRAFAGFDADAVAAYTDDDVTRLLGDGGIIRNRAKILATIDNARIVSDTIDDLDGLLWSFAPTAPVDRPSCAREVPTRTTASTAMAAELKRRGLRFVGPTTAHALMQATGMVDEHVAGCWRVGA